MKPLGHIGSFKGKIYSFVCLVVLCLFGWWMIFCHDYFSRDTGHCERQRLCDFFSPQVRDFTHRDGLKDRETEG